MRWARDWCAERDIIFQPYLAYVNDYQPARDLVKGLLPHEVLEDFSKKLFLHYVDDLIKAKPDNWECPQWNDRITLTHTGDVLLCCVVPDGYPSSNLGSIFDLSREEVISGKKTNKECDDCMGCGVAYWAHNVQTVNMTAPAPAAKTVMKTVKRSRLRRAASFVKRRLIMDHLTH